MEPIDEPLGESPIHAPHERLRHARRAAGFRSASAAARQFGWGDATYRHHENGTRSYGVEQAVQYGKAFSVPATWLLDLSSVGRDAWRLPLAKFYIENNLPELSYWDDMEQVATDAHKVLGLFFVPELTFTPGKIDLARDDGGRPVFHFASPEVTGISHKSFEDGFIFAVKCPPFRPRGVASAGDIFMVDSERGSAGERPELWLIRDDGDVMARWIKSEEDGEHMLISSEPGESAFSLTDDVELVGRVRWIGKKF